MSKMHYFSNKFSKIAKRWGLSAPSASWPLILVTWSFVMVVFEADYDKIKLQNIVMTSFQWRHYYVTEKRHQNNVTKIFPIWVSLNQNFWLRQWS